MFLSRTLVTPNFISSGNERFEYRTLKWIVKSKKIIQLKTCPIIQHVKIQLANYSHHSNFGFVFN